MIRDYCRPFTAIIHPGDRSGPTGVAGVEREEKTVVVEITSTNNNITHHGEGKETGRAN